MKKMMILFSVSLLLFSCRKNLISTDPAAETMRTILQTQLSEKDLGAVDFSNVRTAKLSNGHTVYLATMQKENIIVDVDGNGAFVKGNIYEVSGSVAKVKGAPKFSGVFTRSSLQRGQTVHYSIDNGVVKELHTFSGVSVNSVGGGQRVNYECADCTIPEVVVSTTYRSSGGIDWSTWMSLLSMFDMGSQYDYLGYDFSGGGGGGGGSAPSAPVITIDQENAEDKSKIDQKKYTDCFGSVPDGSTTLYTVTISSDLPTDGHPEIFYNWSDGSPGHAFIELNKSTPYGGVSQDFGFYPTSSYKLLPLDNSVSLPSKIVDDGGHEYQARYTISVTAAQFQAAINAVNAARDTYNVGLYNCTDFALDVFNAAGGGFTIPRHSIPGFEVDGGSNTPQGLYEKIQSMKNNGAANTTTTNNKEHAGSSKGPCD